MKPPSYKSICDCPACISTSDKGGGDINSPGVPMEFVNGSKHEEPAYSRLAPVQGTFVPVFLGSLQLHRGIQTEEEETRELPHRTRYPDPFFFPFSDQIVVSKVCACSATNGETIAGTAPRYSDVSW